MQTLSVRIRFTPHIRRPAPCGTHQGKGCQVTDLDGKTYLDLVAGIAVNVLGHGNDHLVTTIDKAGHRSTVPTFTTMFPKPNWPNANSVGRYGKDFCNSGAEANEAAIKLVRGYFNRSGSSQLLFRSK